MKKVEKDNCDEMALTTDELIDRGTEALARLCEAIANNPTTGQRYRLTAFLAGLYNGPRFPFDMTDLRGLDGNLRRDCLTVLTLDSLAIMEIHCWGVVDAETLNSWFEEDRHYYRAQRRRIGRELYDAKFGSEGHDDEGLTG